MKDLFESKDIKPMLIGEKAEAFDSKDYIYELKMDGERCLAYLDPNMGTELRNKRNMKVLGKVPELADIHKQVNKRCILDGELMVIKNGKPNFFEIQKRLLTSNEFKIHLQSSKYPASFIAFDILYYENEAILDLPLMERKKLLQNLILENEKLAISRYIEEKGREFYHLAEQQDLEGIVAKRRDSPYMLDKRTKDWIKIKNLQDDDFIVCGYIEQESNVVSIILGQYDKEQLMYKGHVILGTSSEDFRFIKTIMRQSQSPFQELPSGNENAIWIEPKLVCIVKYMMKMPNGSLRQPVYKGLRNDKVPEECITK